MVYEPIYCANGCCIQMRDGLLFYVTDQKNKSKMWIPTGRCFHCFAVLSGNWPARKSECFFALRRELHMKS